jgi:hypothetical protein
MVSHLYELCSALKDSCDMVSHLPEHITDICKQYGVYQLKCNECLLMYVGQTGRMLKDWYTEHIQAIRTNKQTSKYAQHILETGHMYHTIE